MRPLILLLALATMLAGCATDPGSGGGAGTTTTTLPATVTSPTLGTTTVATTPATTTEMTTATTTPTPTTSTTTAPTSPTPTGTTAVGVNISSFRFQPASVNVEVGGTVEWTNLDGAPHTATADDGSFDSGTLAQGASFSHTFPTAGSFPYRCDIHSSMRGTVVVG